MIKYKNRFQSKCFDYQTFMTKNAKVQLTRRSKAILLFVVSFSYYNLSCFND